MYFVTEYDGLLEKYNTIWDKTDIKKEFDSDPVYNKQFSRTKIKSHDNELTDICDKEIRKVGSNNTCLAVIRWVSALNKDWNYSLQVFLKEYKYIEKKLIKHINNNLSDFSSYDESDEEWIRISFFFKKKKKKKVRLVFLAI